MCRWIAYSGPAVALEHYVTQPANSLITQSFRALEATCATNGDGFGLGWYGERAEPGLYREVRPAWSDENLRHLCHHIRSHLFFAHVRAATGTAVTRPNCHPFAYGEWLFMHNGYVGNWHRLRRAIEALIPDAFFESRTGTTDSEAIFLAILSSGAEENPIRATEETMTRLKDLLLREDSKPALRFTAALCNGREIYAFRYALNDSANSLYYRRSRYGTVIASEPLDDDRAGWTAVPENSVVIAREGHIVQTLPFLP
jgi:ergothioneine biosynthesis protein EgtC